MLKKISDWFSKSPLIALVVILLIGAVLAIAFRRFIPKPVVSAANALPGSDAKTVA
ncbi:MAG: hypothetical protein WC661_10265 [Opitutaceae bacterium]|jgi:hypothetical protein